jgi:Flp pilus assembly pilin Flp
MPTAVLPQRPGEAVADELVQTNGSDTSTIHPQEERAMLKVLKDEGGSQVTEFGIYAALVIAAAIALLTPIGTAVVGAYTTIVGAI